MRIAAVMLLLALPLGTAACDVARSHKGDDGGTLENKPEGNGRPTDDNEGIPGYLTNPRAIDVRVASPGVVQITAPDGAVKADDGPAERVRVVVASVARTDVETLRAAALEGKPQATLTTKTLATLAPSAAGAFAATVDCGADCFLVISTARPPGEVVTVEKRTTIIRQAAHDLATEAPTFQLDLDEFLRIVLAIGQVLEPHDPRCTLRLPERCWALALEGTLEAKWDHNVEECRSRVGLIAAACFYPPGTAIAAAFDAKNGDPPTTFTYTVPSRTTCTVELPKPCAAAPSLALVLDDAMNDSDADPAMCARRAERLARTCGYEPGTAVKTTFTPLSGEPSVTHAETPPGSSDCEASGSLLLGGVCEPVERLFHCIGRGNSPRLQKFGVAGAEGLGCYARGYDSGLYAYTVLKSPGAGRLPLRRYTRTEADGRISDTVTVGDAAPEGEWTADELLGYVQEAKAEDARATTLWLCPFTDGNLTIVPGDSCGPKPVSAPGHVVGAAFFYEP